MNFKVTSLIVLLLLAVNVVHADTSANEQMQVKQLIKKMYSYDPSAFEFGEFKGKYNPNLHCQLLNEYLEPKLIRKTRITSSADKCIVGDIKVLHNMRYPAIGESIEADDIPSRTDKAVIQTPVVIGDVAKVAVLTPPNQHARTLYFLNKIDGQWKITNALLHWVWPDLDDGAHNCYFEFLRTPSVDEKRETLAHCR